jgi:hypothetical protein
MPGHDQAAITCRIIELGRQEMLLRTNASLVIASAAKQSMATKQEWIASSLCSSQ